MNAQRTLRPKFLIIGAQKGGTTALFRYLAEHPSVAAPDTKEINFFMCDALYRQGLDFYHSYFPRETREFRGKLTFEASANYLRSADAAARIFDYNPHMRLIVLLRDPILRAYSAWQMYQKFYRKNPTWYFDWMNTCYDVESDVFVPRSARFGDSFHDDVKEEMEVAERGKRIEAPFLRHGFYDEQLRAYRSHFPASQVLVECSERFRGATMETLSDVEDFLDIPRHRRGQDSLMPVFVGDYRIDLPTKTIALLQNVYRDRNCDLFEFLGRSFDWL